MSQTPLEEPELPPSLRLLKRLVTVLTLVMILAVITITGLLVIRLPKLSSQPVLPDNLTLPEGKTAQAVTLGTGWIAIVTQDQHILLFSEQGNLLQDIPLLRE